MERDLGELLSEAVPSGRAGPDLDAIEVRATRRRRGISVTIAVAMVALVAGLPRLLPDPPDLPVIGQVPEASSCRAAEDTVQVLDDVDLDGDGVADRVVLRADERSPDELVGCLTEGRVLQLAVHADAYGRALQRVDLGRVHGVALVESQPVAGTKDVILAWVVDGEWRAVSALQEDRPGGSALVQLSDYQVGTGAGTERP